MSKSSETLSKTNISYHILSKNEIQDLINSGELAGLNNDDNRLFIGRFRNTVNVGGTRGFILDKQTGKEYNMIGLNHKLKRTEQDFRNIIKRFYDEDNADLSSQKSVSQVILVDSICVYYGISMDELGKIVKGDIKNEDVNALFNTCLKSINEKFKTQAQPAQQKKQKEQNEIADLVVRKLIEKLNKEESSQLKNEIADLVVRKLEEKGNMSSIPLAPTLPTDVFF